MGHVSVFKASDVNFRQFLDEYTISIFIHKQSIICDMKWAPWNKNKIFKLQKGQIYLTKKKKKTCIRWRFPFPNTYRRLFLKNFDIYLFFCNFIIFQIIIVIFFFGIDNMVCIF
jgi:hypothetical protein